MKRAVKKCILLLAGLALAAVLSGCTVFDSSVEQLFTLPRMAPEYTGLSQQLDSLIAQGYEYASPSGGRNIQSVQMLDLEDDGRQEAMVFMRRGADEKPLKIMVFRLDEDEGYRLLCTIESSGTAVESVYYQDLNGDGRRELIVGWRISADVQTLAAYTLSEAQIENMVTAKGYQDCVVFMADESVSVVVSAGEDGLQTEDIARITDIVKQETGLGADKIKILEVN